jgi:hypothetical protein
LHLRPAEWWRGAHVALAGTLWLGACGVSEHPLGSDQVSGADGGACLEGSRVRCTCEGARVGTQLCRRGAYGSCACASEGELACRAGYYVGEFSGSYRPGFFGFGVGGSGLPFDIAGGPGGGRPGLSLTLVEVPTGAGEFATYRVGNGCMVGNSKAVGTNNPFVANFTGDLDCLTGEFKGELEGYYTLLSVPGANFRFGGEIQARFEIEEARLNDGIWDVTEPDALNGDPAGGGKGTWSARFQGENGPADDPCKVLAPDGGFAMPMATPSDAGFSDAGPTGGRSARN